MTVKYIQDMSRDELIKVYNANEKLQEDVVVDMLNSEMSYINEQLDYLKDGLRDWNIGVNNHNYLTVGNSSDFILALSKVEKSIPILGDEDESDLDYAIKLRDEYMSTDMDTDKFYELEQELEKVANSMANLVTKRFNEILNGCHDEKYQLEYFTDFYVDARMGECFIYTDRNDYVLYEQFVISYD